MTIPAITSKYQKIALLLHCTTCTGWAASQYRTFQLFRAGAARPSSSTAYTTLWRLHSNTTESFSLSALLLLHETRTVNVKALDFRKTSEWTSPWIAALYDVHAFPKPAVRFFFGAHSVEKRIYRGKEWGELLNSTVILRVRIEYRLICIMWWICTMLNSCHTHSALDGNMHWFKSFFQQAASEMICWESSAYGA